MPRITLSKKRFMRSTVVLATCRASAAYNSVCTTDSCTICPRCRIVRRDAVELAPDLRAAANRCSSSAFGPPLALSRAPTSWTSADRGPPSTRRKHGAANDQSCPRRPYGRRGRPRTSILALSPRGAARAAQGRIAPPRNSLASTVHIIRAWESAKRTPDVGQPSCTPCRNWFVVEFPAGLLSTNGQRHATPSKSARAVGRIRGTRRALTTPWADPHRHLGGSALTGGSARRRPRWRTRGA